MVTNIREIAKIGNWSILKWVYAIETQNDVTGGYYSDMYSVLYRPDVNLTFQYTDVDCFVKRIETNLSWR